MGNSHRGIQSIFPQIMSRNMYCDRCAGNKMPFPGNIAIFFGEKRNRFFYEKIEQDNSALEYGFTPHIILNPSIIILNDRQMVSFFAYCGIHGCGVENRSFRWSVLLSRAKRFDSINRKFYCFDEL